MSKIKFETPSRSLNLLEEHSQRSDGHKTKDGCADAGLGGGRSLLPAAALAAAAAGLVTVQGLHVFLGRDAGEFALDGTTTLGREAVTVNLLLGLHVEGTLDIADGGKLRTV